MKKNNDNTHDFNSSQSKRKEEENNNNTTVEATSERNNNNKIISNRQNISHTPQPQKRGVNANKSKEQLQRSSRSNNNLMKVGEDSKNTFDDKINSQRDRPYSKNNVVEETKKRSNSPLLQSSNLKANIMKNDAFSNINGKFRLKKGTDYTSKNDLSNNKKSNNNLIEQEKKKSLEFVELTNNTKKKYTSLKEKRTNK